MADLPEGYSIRQTPVHAPQGLPEGYSVRGAPVPRAKPDAPPVTLEQRAQDVYGFDPGLERATILPFGKNEKGETEFAVPQIGVDLLTSFLLPGHAAQGGKYTPEDALKFTLDFAAPATSRGVSSVARTKPTRKDVIANAPKTGELFAKGGADLEAAKTSAVSLKPEKYLDFMAGMETRLAEEGADPMLHPKIAAVFNAMSKRVGQEVDMADLHTISRQMGIAARSTAPDLADERRIASIMQDKLNDLIDNLGADDLAAGTADDAALAARNLKAGKALWARGKKAETIEGIVENAMSQASGFENGLRIGFRNLLKDKKRIRGFTPAERLVMKEIERGTPVTKALRFLGKLGPGTSGSANILGASIGGGVGGSIGAALGGPLGAAVGAPAMMGVGMAAGRGAASRTGAAAEYLRALAASGAQEASPFSRLAEVLAKSARPQISLPVAGAEMQTTADRDRLARALAGGR